MTQDAGFSLVEVVMATALTMSVTGAVVSLATPAGRLSPAFVRFPTSGIGTSS